jgi:hypothetical protein
MLPDATLPVAASLMTLLTVFSAVHRAVVPHLVRPGLRFSRPARKADGVQDAD